MPPRGQITRATTTGLSAPNCEFSSLAGFSIRSASWPRSENHSGSGLRRKLRTVSLSTALFRIDEARLRERFNIIVANPYSLGPKFLPSDFDSDSVRIRRRWLFGGKPLTVEVSLSLFSHGGREAWKTGWALWGVLPI